MLKIYNTNSNNEFEKIDEIKKGCWIDIVKPTEEDVKFLTDSFEIDASFISYFLDDEETPRIDIDDDTKTKMIILDVPIKEKNNGFNVITTIPLAILIIKDIYVVTVSLEDSDTIKAFKHNKIKNFYSYKKTRFILQIFYHTATSYLKYLRNLNKEIEKAETRMLKATNNTDLANLLSIEKSLVYMTTSLKSNEIVLEKILKGNILPLYEEDNELLEDAIVENKQCIDMANLYREILSSTTDSYASIISNNLNTIMKFLAGVTIVISIPTMVASFMGMNVPLGDLMTNDHAFIILVAISLFLSLIVAWILKRRNML